MYKIANNAAPVYLTDLFQFRSNESNVNYSQLNLRSTSNGNYLILRPKINLFKTVCLIPLFKCGTVFLYGLKVQVQLSHLQTIAYVIELSSLHVPPSPLHHISNFNTF